MNIVLCILIVAVVVLLVYRFFFKQGAADLDSFEDGGIDHYSEDFLKSETIRVFDEILQTDYSALNLNKFETIKNERNRGKLRASLKNCSCGNIGSKLYVKDYVKDLLQRKLGINEETVDKVIPFTNPSELTAQDKFEILLYAYKMKYDLYALSEMIDRNGLARPYGSGASMHYEVTKPDVDELYARHRKVIDNLDYYDKLNIVAQRVYQLSYGHGAIDEIRDMVIDGINCGTSGIPSTFYMYGADARYGAEVDELPLTACNSIWVMYRGKLLHFSFMGFGTERELQRVSKLVYRYDSPGTLDASTGYIVNFMQDGSRVAVARPPFCESWVFFIRKFDVASKMSLRDLYPYEGNDKLVETLRWLVTGCRNIALTGEQFTGKSTLLVSMVQFIPEAFSIRVEEMAFEMYLRKIYPKRNITTFRETATVSGQEGIDFQKKTDGTVSIFGEVAQAAVASLAIQMGQVGASQVMFTHHARTVADLVEAFRDNMIEAAGYNNEKVVEKTVARVLNFNVHIARTVGGKRYIERVTEIRPKDSEDYPKAWEDASLEYFYRSTDRQLFESSDILVYDGDKYVFSGMLSDWSIQEISKNLTSEEKKEFEGFISAIEEEVTYASK